MSRVHSRDALIPGELVARLEAVRHTREDWHEPYGAIDLPCDADDYGATAHLINPDGPAVVALIRSLATELELWRSGRRTRGFMPNGHPCIVDHPDDPNAEVRDSETGEVLFPAVKAPFRVIDGVCVCVARGDGPEGCGLCNETGKATTASSVGTSACASEPNPTPTGSKP